MTIHGRKITDADMHDIAGYMDDEIRDAIHAQLAPCSNEEFLDAYIAHDPDIVPILENEFEFEQ